MRNNCLRTSGLWIQQTAPLYLALCWVLWVRANPASAWGEVRWEPWKSYRTAQAQEREECYYRDARKQHKPMVPGDREARVQGRARSPQADRAGSSHARGKSELYFVKKTEEPRYFPPHILRADFLPCFLWDSKNRQLIKLSPRCLTCHRSAAKCSMSSDPLCGPGCRHPCPHLQIQKPSLCPVPGPRPPKKAP